MAIAEDKDFDEMLNRHVEIKRSQQTQESVENSAKQTQEIVDLKDSCIVEVQDSDQTFINALANNTTAIEVAKEKYEAVSKQRRIGNRIERVATRKTNADIEEVNTAVEEQEKNIRVKKQKIRNELLTLKNEKIYLKREQKHRLKIQKFEQRKEKYGDLMMKYCRRKQKDENGKMVFLKDKDGKYLLNYPNTITLCFLLFFDTIVMTLNQIMEVLTATNKTVVKGIFIIFIILAVFVEPIRNWILGSIGIQIGG